MDIFSDTFWAIFLSCVALCGGVIAVCTSVVAIARLRKLEREVSAYRDYITTLYRYLTTLEARLSPRPSEPTAPAQHAAEPVVEPQAAPFASFVPFTPPTAQPASVQQEIPLGHDVSVAPPTTEPARDDLAAMEANLGKRWVTWAGVLTLFFGVAFFVRYAIDVGWLGPTTRVVLGVVLGIALLIAGDRAIRQPYRALGVGLMGGGLAVLYVSLYAAFSLYHLLPAPAAFCAMVLVTAGGLTLAVLHDAIALSFLALLGGILTPVMVATGENAREVLGIYLLLLDLGVLGVAFFKHWRALDVLAFAGTVLLCYGWYTGHYTDDQLIPACLWIGVFYLIFLVLPFLYHLRYRLAVPVESFILALANAGLSFTALYVLLSPLHHDFLAFVALGISAASLAMGAGVRRQLPFDDKAIFAFIALAVTFLTLAIPIHLKAYGVSLAWAIEGPVLLYLGYRFRYFPVRLGGLIVLMLAVFRLFITCWPLHTQLYLPFGNLSFFNAILIPLIIAIYALIHYLWRAERSDDDRTMQHISAIGAGALALFLIQAEVGVWYDLHQMHNIAQLATACLWAVGGLLFILAGERTRTRAAAVVGFIALCIAANLLLVAYSAPETYPALFVNPRFGAVLVTAISAFLAWQRLYQHQGNKSFQQALIGYVEVLLFLMLSLESYIWGSHRAADSAQSGWIAQMALSLTWGAYASVLLLAGFWRRSRGMRLTALAGFGVTALKLLFIDMASVEQLYRILSFFILGLLMIGASFLYHAAEKRLEQSAEESTDEQSAVE